MNDPLLVRGFEGIRNLRRDRERLVDRDRALRDAVGQRRSFDQLHHERRRTLGSFQAVDRRDVEMAQRSEDLCLALEPREPLTVGGERFRQDFDRDRPVQVRVGGAIDFTHPAHADLGADFVRAEAGAWLE